MTNRMGRYLYTCLLQDSQKLPESSLRFIQDHSIMDEAVPAYFGGKPVFIQTNIQ